VVTIEALLSIAILSGLVFFVWVVLAARKESKRMGWTGKK